MNDIDDCPCSDDENFLRINNTEVIKNHFQCQPSNRYIPQSLSMDEIKQMKPNTNNGYTIILIRVVMIYGIARMEKTKSIVDPSPPLNCSSNEHICISPCTNQLICLPLSKANIVLLVFIIFIKWD